MSKSNRFWDSFVSQSFKTIKGFKAKFNPTLGGTSTAWQKSKLKISASITDTNDKSYLKDIGVFKIKKVKTSLKGSTAQILLDSQAKPLQGANAEKVKDAGQWWENVPISFIINQLLESVYRGEDGQLPDSYVISRKDLSREEDQEDKSFWNLGVPPNWDGQSFQPNPDAYPLTSMVSGGAGNILYVGLGGLETFPSEIWSYNTEDDVWSFIISTGFQSPIQELFFNQEDNLLYGITWKDQAESTADIINNPEKIVTCRAQIIWANPLEPNTGSSLADLNQYQAIPDFFPGKWDIREAFPLTPETKTPQTSLTDIQKTTPRAGVGNIQAYGYHSLPLPSLDYINGPGAGNSLFFAKTEESSPELFHLTDESGETTWSLSGGVPQGTIDAGDAGSTVSWVIAGDKIALSPTLAGIGFGFSIEDLIPNGDTFRVKVSQLTTDNPFDLQLRVRFRVAGSNQIVSRTVYYFEQGQDGNHYSYIKMPYANARLDLRISIGYFLDTNPDNTPFISFKDLSVKKTHSWRTNTQTPLVAGENIPITSYSKVVTGFHLESGTHPGEVGPSYDLGEGANDFNSVDLESQYIQSFDFLGSQIGWAVGTYQSIFKTTDSGETWSKQYGSVDDRSLRGVHVIDADTVWVVGRGLVMYTLDGGIQWQQVILDPDNKESTDYEDVYFVDNQVGFITASSGVNGGTNGGVYRTLDGGVNWFQILGNKFYEITTLNGTDLFFRGQVFPFPTPLVKLTSNNGTSWTDITPIDPDSGNPLYGLQGYYPAAINGGNPLTHAFITTNLKGFKTTDSGATLSVFLPFDDMHFIDNNVGFLVSNDPVTWVYKTTNGGENWQPLSSPILNFTPYFSHIYFIDADRGFVTGVKNQGGGFIIYTNDGGNNWVSIGENARADEIFLDFNMISQDRRPYGDNYLTPLLDGERNTIPLDTLWRDRIGIGLDPGAIQSEPQIINLAPTRDIAQLEPAPSIGAQGVNSSEQDFKTFRAGTGYLSVQAQLIGNRTVLTDQSKYSNIYGLVRHTNNQQGFFVFSQSSNLNKGKITFAKAQVNSFHKFKVGPGATSVKFTLHTFDCENKTIEDVDVELTDPDPPQMDNLPFPAPEVNMYPIAGASIGSRIYFSTQSVVSVAPPGYQSPCYVYELNLDNHQLRRLYNSKFDNSQYNQINSEGAGFIPGNINDEYLSVTPNNKAGAINKTRKICWLHYNPQFTGKLMGWSFRKDSLIISPDQALIPPCHEVFYLPIVRGYINNELPAAKTLPDVTNPGDKELTVVQPYSGLKNSNNSQVNQNSLIIVDHDHQDGQNADCVGFVGFTNGLNKTWYVRLRKPTVAPSYYESLGLGVAPSYYQESQGYPEGGVLWDGASFPRFSQELFGSEGFISNNKALAITRESNGETKDILFSSFDNYITPLTIKLRDYWDTVGSSRVFFKLDSGGLDQRIPLADFSGLKVWDAIAKISKAYSYVFGFDIEEFFILPRDKTSPSFELKEGDDIISDINKETSDDIRNVVMVAPYSPRLEDPSWEVIHVTNNTPGTQEIDQDLFSGDILVNTKSQREASITFICTKEGRLITGTQGGGETVTTLLGDSTFDPWDKSRRNPPLFKWLMYLPTIEIVSLKGLSENGTILFVNTTFVGSSNRIELGDMLIFTDPENFKQTSRLIVDIDYTLNRLVLENPLGFSVDKFTPLIIVRAHAGSGDSNQNNSPQNRTWNTRYSDEGVAIVKSRRWGFTDQQSEHKVLHIQSLLPFEDNLYQIVVAQLNSSWEVGTIINIKYQGNTDHSANGRFEITHLFPVWDQIRVRALTDNPLTGAIDNTSGELPIYAFQSDNPDSTVNTILKLNTLAPFRGVNLRKYAEDYRHFTFVVTTLPTQAISNIDLPDLTGNSPIAYVHSINQDSMEISIGPGDYENFFKEGDVLNFHYMLAPTSEIQEPTGVMLGLSQDIPGGMGSMRWAAEPEADRFEFNSVIQLKFPGASLVKDASSIYQGTNNKSIKTWGAQEYTLPDNRFITQVQAPEWTSKILDKYGDPSVSLKVTARYVPEISFLKPGSRSLAEVLVTSPTLFPSREKFQMRCSIKVIEINLEAKTMIIELTGLDKH